ncbi:alpha/beta hydrolase [Rhodococcus sp. 06-621-2]|nr:alpha/beta hydrolase [Rhodococcus sp. 06-621-2]OZC60099.1 alpha/beta hydrolase [Rhodococcus sp. 06-621-2]
MPTATVNGITLNYQVKGSGPLVVLIMGTGSPGRVWDLHQVPALVKAGYRVCFFDNRGIAPSFESVQGITIDDLVADTAALIELVREGDEKAFVVGTSMGARVAQELALRRPELLRKAVFLAGHARLDEFQRTLGEGEVALADAKTQLPPKYAAAITAALNLSPTTLADSRTARDWLDLLEFSVAPVTPGVRAQIGMDDSFDRTSAYGKIDLPCLSVGFEHDRMIPPFLGAELAKAIPDAQYIEIPDVGHYGYLERPDAVNDVILEFLKS